MPLENILSKLNIDNLSIPDSFREKIKILQEQLPSILDDFKKSYVLYNKNPEFDEYKNMFDNMKQNLEHLISQVFTTTNNNDASIEDINKKMKTLNILITKEREENRILKLKLGIVETKQDGSNIMINNYTDMYNNDYLKNWALFLGIIILCIILTKFKKVVQPSTTANYKK